MRQREGAAPLETKARPSAPAKEATSHGSTESHAVNSERRAGHLAHIIAVLLLIVGSWGIVIGLWQAVDHAPNVTIPFIIVGCILTVGRILWLEVRR